MSVIDHHWKKGFFRVWIVFYILWIMVVGFRLLSDRLPDPSIYNEIPSQELVRKSVELIKEHYIPDKKIAIKDPPRKGSARRLLYDMSIERGHIPTKTVSDKNTIYNELLHGNNLIRGVKRRDGLITLTLEVKKPPFDRIEEIKFEYLKDKNITDFYKGIEDHYIENKNRLENKRKQEITGKISFTILPPILLLIFIVFVTFVIKWIIKGFKPSTDK